MSQALRAAMARSVGIGEELAVGIEPKIRGRGVWRAALLMYQAHGRKAAQEAAARALARRLRGDDAGFDVWSWISAAIRDLDERVAARKTAIR